MADDIITNNTSEYLKFHADMEQDPLPPGTSIEVFFGSLADMASNGGLDHIKFDPHMTLGEVAELCKGLSTEARVVYARAEWADGKLVVALRSELRPQGLDALLRIGSTAPLSSLMRRQAS